MRRVHGNQQVVAHGNNTLRQCKQEANGKRKAVVDVFQMGDNRVQRQQHSAQIPLFLRNFWKHVRPTPSGVAALVYTLKPRVYAMPYINKNEGVAQWSASQRITFKSVNGITNLRVFLY